MTHSFVLHLSSTALRDGDIRGVVEVVATGERTTVKTLEELRDLLARQARCRSAEATDPTDGEGA